MDKKRLLVVEDEAVTAKDLASDLIQLGYEVVGVTDNAEDAIRLAAELLPDLILMDITLAGPTNGIQAADQIRKVHAIPIVFMTAHSDINTIECAKTAEPFGYLPKPCNVNSLMSTIELALYKSMADAQLKEALERYHTVADFTYDWEYWIAQQNRIVYMSPSCERITGYGSAEFMADPDLMSRIVHPEDASVYERHRHRRVDLSEGSGSEEIEFRILTRSNELRWIHHICQPIHGADGTFRGMRASNRDITERKRAEDDLKRVVNEQKIIIENLGVGVLFLKDRKIIWANRSLGNMFGYTLEEAVGKDTEMFYPDRKTYSETGEKAYAALSRGGIYCFETQLKRNSGSLMWCNLVGQAVNPANLQEGAIWLIEDITARKNMEAELSRTRNLESLGILAGGIAHDFNNLLQALLGNIDMAKIYTPVTSKAWPFLSNAELAYNAAVNLTGQLIAFSSGGNSVRQTLQPGQLIREVISIILEGSGIKTVFDLPQTLRSIHVDTSQLRQVIGNIALNAQDAMPADGILMVSASNELLKSDDISGLAPGAYVKISIRDQGAGIDPEILPKIFDPYFSTKERGPQKGMGLGLTVADAIIRKHNGTIKIASDPGKGTVVHIYLPAAAADTETSDMNNNAAQTGRRVLVMDDEASVYRIVADYLEFIGYSVDTVLNGEEAIRAYAAAQQACRPYAVVLLDLEIPGGMGGQETFLKLQEIDPKVRAIISSGYSSDPIMLDYSLYGYKGALVKPYRLEALKEMLEKILQPT